jgi:hypothetical protein
MESWEALLMWRFFPNAHKPHKKGHPSRITIPHRSRSIPLSSAIDRNTLDMEGQKASQG